MTKTVLSIVVPAYNEQEVLEEFHGRLLAVLAPLDVEPDILYVDDGSSDDTPALLQQLKRHDPHVGVISLSRNFGKEAALTAGINHACGDAVVVIDADLQDPPELIPEFIRVWREENADVVYGQRTARDGETWFKKSTASLFYRMMQRIGRVRIPKDTGDFRLMDRRAVEALKQLPEHHRFMKGLFAWIGFKQVAVSYRRDPRYAGETKWNYWQLWNLAIEGFTSYSVTPLKIATYIGMVIAIGAFLYGLIMISRTLLFGNPVAGYPSLLVVVLFLGGIQLLFIGILGEYLGRIFNETKRRPLYLIETYRPSSAAETRAQPGEAPAPSAPSETKSEVRLTL
ncbi:MAG: glycosyltransferase family 2 protein [Pseudomonadota bacterium]